MWDGFYYKDLKIWPDYAICPLLVETIPTIPAEK